MGRLQLNNDRELVNKIIDKVFENNGYCPCKRIKIPETLCPCEDMIKNNKCNCGLYVDYEKEQN